MNGPRRIGRVILGSLSIVVASRGVQAQTAPPAPAKPAASSPPVSASATDLALTGLKMTVPSGWVREEAPQGPMAPVAVYKIPRSDPAGDDGSVRITHYPNMKGKEMDDRNIDRWVGQVAKPDGQPAARSDAKITTTEIGPVKLTLVDMSGSIKATMRDSAKPDYRMIAAIVDHPQGPHFVVTTGPAASMEKWSAQIDAFLKSAKTQ